MFDRFGEFNSVEELNMAAEGQKEQRDEIAFYALAKENGIEKEDAADFWNGDTDKLATVRMAAFGRITVLEEEEINKNKNPIEKRMLQVILAMIKGMCADKDIAEAVMKKGKRLGNILNAMRNEARKHKFGDVAMSCGTDRQLQEIIKVYFTGTDNELRETIEKLYL